MMLNQKDPIKIEETAPNSEETLNHSETATNTNIKDLNSGTSDGCASNDCEFETKQERSLTNKHNPSLNDHDYCSPNKTPRKKSNKPTMKQDSVTQSQQMTANLHDQQSSQASTLTASECPTSSSSTPTKLRSDSQSSNKIEKLQQSMADTSEHVDDKNINPSSSSSSDLSDDDSGGLVIADSRPKSLAPKDTPSVSRPKPGRRPSSNLINKQGTAELEHTTRKRRPRHNTSVTDKSQWITGEDQVDTALSEHLSSDRREKRQRKEVHDPDFSHFTSSDYSSSDAESDDSDEDDDENDPERPWCMCMKPHGGQFMICCDICSYWYHGMCVGVTEQMSKRYAKENKEWFCGECQTHLQNGTPRNAIPTKIVKKEKKPKAGKSGKRGRGRPRKSDGPTRGSARLSSRLAARKSSTSLDSKMSTRKTSNKYDAARRESFELFGDEQRLKGLIRERKQAFLFKRQLAEKERLAKMKELGMTGHTVTGALGNSLDTLATSTSSPNMSNLPLDIKSDHKERAKHNIVLQINTKKDGEVTAVVKSMKRKQSESSDHPVDDLFTADPIQVSKRSKPDTVKQEQDSRGSTSTTTDRRSSNGTKGEKFILNESGELSQATPKKKRKDSESNSTASFGSKDIANKLKERLESSAKSLKDFIAPHVSNIEKLAIEIESNLNECFKEGSQKYLNKYRSLIFNFTKNLELVRNVISGEIAPAKLVRMSPEEMAPHELAKWRERHSKHEIELIKHSAQLAAQQVIVKKTHKGEEVISAPSLNESDDPTADLNQDPPTTPTKKSIKDTTSPQMPENITSSDIHQSTDTKKISVQVQSRADQPISTNDSHEKSNDQTSLNSSAAERKSDFRESETGEESNNESEISSSKSDSGKIRVDLPAPQQSEPKRFRVSIETSLDPTNLSRLRDQPLIKPSEKEQEAGGYSPSKVTPNADLNSNDEAEIEDEEELYDPETMLPEPSNNKLEPVDAPIALSTLPWSGNITMADVGKFSATISSLSGDSSFMQEEIAQNLLVCGRIKPEQVSTYIKQIKSTTKNPIISIQFHPKTTEDKATYDRLFDYLYTRNRYGVIDNRSHQQVFRDFYIIPIHEGGCIPEVSKPIQGPGLNKKHPNCLIGLIVKTKRPGLAQGTSSANTSYSGYTPTPIK